MSVLVTGGAGFLGTHLTEALRVRGDEVVVLDAAPTDAATPGVAFVAGDVTRPGTVADVIAEHAVTSVVHAAAIVGVAASAQGPAHCVRTNIAAAANVFEAALDAGVRRVVDLSSEEVYGDFQRDPIAEDDPCDPHSPYGVSKFASERLGRYYARQHGLPYVAARLCWVYGPGFPRERLPQPWLADIAAGRPSRLDRGGDQRLDLTYVADAVAGILAVHDAPAPQCLAYNIATGRAVSVRELADVLSTRHPGWSVQVGDGPLELAPGVTAARKGALSIDRAAAEFRYQPHTSLVDGLDRTLRSLTGAAA